MRRKHRYREAIRKTVVADMKAATPIEWDMIAKRHRIHTQTARIWVYQEENPRVGYKEAWSRIMGRDEVISAVSNARDLTQLSALRVRIKELEAERSGARRSAFAIPPGLASQQVRSVRTHMKVKAGSLDDLAEQMWAYMLKRARNFDAAPQSIDELKRACVPVIAWALRLHMANNARLNDSLAAVGDLLTFADQLFTDFEITPEEVKQ